jgi:hypothetical protein
MLKLKRTSIKTQVTAGKRNYMWFLLKHKIAVKETHRIFTRSIVA